MILWLRSLLNHPNVFNVSLAYQTDNRIFGRTLIDLTCLNLTADKISKAIFVFQQVWSCLSICAKLIHDTVQFVKSSRTSVMANKSECYASWNKNKKIRLPCLRILKLPYYTERRLQSLNLYISRYEYFNKGADLFVESLARLNHLLKVIFVFCSHNLKLSIGWSARLG